ncbi:hypothetical protein HAX54_010912, partial [Datura stramonium]|nr:hypothetical protein [Datura stramonium]
IVSPSNESFSPLPSTLDQRLNLRKKGDDGSLNESLGNQMSHQVTRLETITGKGPRLRERLVG